MPYQIEDAYAQWKALMGFAGPKNGKSTLAFYAPQPIVVLNYDGGNPGIPPGVQGRDIYIQNYPVAENEVDPSNAKWSRSGEVGAQVIKDILDVRNTLVSEADELELMDWYTMTPFKMPRPKTVILDGLVQFNNILLDWLMASEKMKDTADARQDALKFWSMRLSRMNTLFRFILPLPCNKVFNTWATDEMEGTGANRKPTGVVIPDIGGKMNDWAAGIVDASLYFFTERANNRTKYYVCTKPNASVKCVGVRGRYDLPDVLDITIDPARPKNLWDELWNHTESNQKSLTKQKGVS